MVHNLARMYVAFKEIRRSLGRFGLLSLAVALLVLLLLFFQAVAGTLTSGLTGGLESSSADLFVYSERARLNPANSLIVTGTAESVAEVDGVAEVAPIGLAVFTGSGPKGDVDVELVGGDPEGPSVPAEIADGRLPETAGEALFSASSFDDPMEIGDTVEVEDITFTIVGTADDAAFNVLPTLYVLFDDYAAATKSRAGAPIDVSPTMLGVTVTAGSDPLSVVDDVNAAVEGVEAVDKAAAIDGLPGVGQITQSFNILYVLLYIVVAIVTGVFFLILTVQKEKALILLRALGAASSDIVKSVLIQVLVVVGSGAVVGTLVTAGLLNLTTDLFGATLDPRTTVITIAAIVVLGLAASVGAVRRVLAIDPLEATRVRGI